MSKEVLEGKLAELMDTVPECEGLIAADADGNVIVGQTLTELDDESIAKLGASILKDSTNLGSKVDKGGFKSATIQVESGFILVVGSKNKVLIGIAGEDGQASLSLIKRHLISIANL